MQVLHNQLNSKNDAVFDPKIAGNHCRSRSGCQARWELDTWVVLDIIMINYSAYTSIISRERVFYEPR